MVTATLTGLNTSGATVSIGGVAAISATIGGQALTFTIPDDAPAGAQQVAITANGATVTQTLTVLGEVVPGRATLLLAAGADLVDLSARLLNLGFVLDGDPIPLGATSGPCSGQLAEIDVGGTPLGQALEQLEALEQESPGVILFVDPKSDYNFDQVDHLATVGAPAAHARGSDGAGTLIAIFDSGVSNHGELAGRIRFDLGFNAVAPGNAPADDFGIVGHGTPVAVLAAGTLSGVAPAAEIIPVKVCDALGSCLSSDVIVGVCQVLGQAEAFDHSDDLVLNLSLGGDTPVAALEAILAYALDQGVPIAASAGNEGASGSPIHYPAAFELPGLVAVAAVAAETLSCVTFDDQTLGTQFVEDQSLVDAGASIDVGNFNDFGITTSGFSEIHATAQAGGLGNDAQLNNVTMDFGFPYPPRGVDAALRRLRRHREPGDQRRTGRRPQHPSIGRHQQRRCGGSGESGAQPESRHAHPQRSHRRLRPRRPGAVNRRGLPLGRCRLGAGRLQHPGSLCGHRSARPGAAKRQSWWRLRPVRGRVVATPLIAGAQALWRQQNPAATPAAIAQALTDGARPLFDATSAPYPADAVGAGMVDVSVAP